MKDNTVLVNLIENLMKSKKPVWKKVAYELSRPRRKKIEMNISRIVRYAPQDSTVIVPGKVLGAGAISKKLSIAAFSFSENARKLIGQSGGTAMSIESLYKSNPDGRGIMILK